MIKKKPVVISITPTTHRRLKLRATKTGLKLGYLADAAVRHYLRDAEAKGAK